MAEKLEFLSAVLLVSRDASRLAHFYQDVLGVPLEEELHEGAEPHWGCQLGDLHFAIHPVEDFEDDTSYAVGAVKLAFTVFDLESYVAMLREKFVQLVYPTRDHGWCKMTALRDPDGNYVELTQLADEWYEHLGERKARGIDVVEKWRHLRRR